MIKKCFIVLLLVISLSLVFSSNVGKKTLACEWRDSCVGDEDLLFSASGDVSYTDPGNGEPLSSPVDLGIPVPNHASYTQKLCCKSELSTDLDFSIETGTSICPADKANQVLFFNALTNSRVSITNDLNYNNVLCANLTDQFSRVDIKVSNDKKFETSGYSCVFRLSGEESGVISSCDSSYDGGSKKYDYGVWVRLVENIDNLQCNLDCTSKLTGRINQDCGFKVRECQGIPDACDGSLLGAWVDNGVQEIQCESPWRVREKVFSNLKLKVENEVEGCQNMIKKRYPVLIDNEPVVMNIYVCGD